MRKLMIGILEEESGVKQALFNRNFELVPLQKSQILEECIGRNVDLIIMEVKEGGLDIVERIRKKNKTIPIIFVTRQSSEDLAIEALRAGVNDYLKLPLIAEGLCLSINRLCGISDAESQEFGASGLANTYALIGQSLRILEIKAYIRKVALSESNVLITGETGTGKELVAELIYKNSPRHQKPFISVNCAAIPDNLLESELFGYESGAFTGAHARKDGKLKSAEGGTVFFDEIGDMSSYLQAKILRAVETKEVQRLGGKANLRVDVRFIAATNRDLELLVAENRYRSDLYFRLNVARIQLPALRERREDIRLLLDHYIREFNLRLGREVEGFTDDVLESLLVYHWPGNVRELRNLMEAIFVNQPSSKIAFADLPEHFRNRLDNNQEPAPNERERLLSALFAANWNKSQAAEKLQWSRMTVYRKMAKYQIQEDSRPAA